MYTQQSTNPFDLINKPNKVNSLMNVSPFAQLISTVYSLKSSFICYL